MGRSRRNVRPSTKLEYPDAFESLEATTVTSSEASSSAAMAFEDTTTFFEGVTSFGAVEHLMTSGPFETTSLFEASSSMGLEASHGGVVTSAVAPPGTSTYRGGRQKDAMVSADERRKRDNHNQVERRRRLDIAVKLSALQRHVKRPASTKKEIIMAALVQRQNDVEEIKRLESMLAGLEAMDSQYGL